MMKIVLLFASLFGAHAFVLPGPATAPLRVAVVSMNGAEPVKAPKSGWSLTMAGGERTVEDVYKAQQKAAKSEDIYAQREPELDLKRTEKGWNTMNRN